MTTTYYSQYLAANLMYRRVNPVMSSFIMTREFADQTPHRPSMPDADGSDAFNLKKLGATRAVRIVV